MLFVRRVSTARGPPQRYTPKADLLAARNQLALSSLKDIFDGFLTTDEELTPLNDTELAAVSSNPPSFLALNTFHQGQVVDALAEKQKRGWKGLSMDDKRLAHFIWYGPWGPREGFKDYRTPGVVPVDIPWTRPSPVRQAGEVFTSTVPATDVTKVSPQRLQAFHARRLDPALMAVLWVVVVVAVGAVYRDKFVGEAGMPVNPVVEVPPAPAAHEEATEPAPTPRRWYYLWIR